MRKSHQDIGHSNRLRCLAFTGSEVRAEGTNKNSGTSLLWFKHDLRLDDHPGLHQAMAMGDVIPVFVFDPKRYSAVVDSKDMSDALVSAVHSLSDSLEEKGTSLVVCRGTWKEMLPKIFNSYGCSNIFTEDECEKTWLGGLQEVVDAVGEAHVSKWRAPLFNTYQEAYSEIYSGKKYNRIRLFSEKKINFCSLMYAFRLGFWTQLTMLIILLDCRMGYGSG